MALPHEEGGEGLANFALNHVLFFVDYEVRKRLSNSAWSIFQYFFDDTHTHTHEGIALPCCTCACGVTTAELYMPAQAVDA